jgi:hypothetical protein
MDNFFKIVFGAAITMIVLTVLCIVIAVNGCRKIAEEVDEHGLKSVISNVWEGASSTTNN